MESKKAKTGISKILIILTMLILLAPTVNAGVINDVSDFFTNVFTDKQVINYNNVRIGAQKKIIFDGSAGYLPIEIENLDSLEKDLEIGLKFQDDLCEVLWYEAYEYVNEPYETQECIQIEFTYENKSIEYSQECS